MSVEQSQGNVQGQASQPVVSTDVSWLKYRHLARFLARMQRKATCRFELDRGQPGLSIEADDKAARVMNSQLGALWNGRFWKGLAVGTVLGVILAYVLIPSLGTYMVSSKAGLLPPEYDALIRTKNPSEQALQILEHAFEEHSKGAFGRKKVYFEAEINDSSSIRLAYDTDRKGLVMAVSQKVGSDMAQDMVRSELGKTGVDSVIGRVAGGGGVTDGVGDAVGRAASMSVEKGYRSNPVITVSTMIEGEEAELVNYYTWDGRFSKELTARDADTTEMKNGDHVRVRRELRAPQAADQQLYIALVKEFLSRYRAGEYTSN